MHILSLTYSLVEDVPSIFLQYTSVLYIIEHTIVHQSAHLQHPYTTHDFVSASSRSFPRKSPILCSEIPVLALLRTENLKLLLYTKLSCRFLHSNNDYFDLLFIYQHLHTEYIFIPRCIAFRLIWHFCIQYTFISLSPLSLQKIPEPSSGFRDPIINAPLRKYFRFKLSSLLLRSYSFFISPSPWPYRGCHWHPVHIPSSCRLS